eukprot:2009784-Prymnesium_polylepis.1
MSDAVDGRSAARCRNTTVRQKAERNFSSDPAHPGLRHVPRGRAAPADALHVDQENTIRHSCWSAL